MRFILGLKDTWPLQQKWVWNNQSDAVKNCFICCRQVKKSRLWKAWKSAWSYIWVQLLSDNHLSDGWCDCMVQNALFVMWESQWSPKPVHPVLLLISENERLTISLIRGMWGSTSSQQYMQRAWSVLVSAVTVCAGAGHRTWCCTCLCSSSKKTGRLP